MNELLAIIIIVFVCCAIFCAWLLSMATCPDKMVDWLNGTSSNSTCSTSYESKELINKSEDSGQDNTAARCSAETSSFYLQLGQNKMNPKKLSVVPEQDEQLTVTSISQILYPSIHKAEDTIKTDVQTCFNPDEPECVVIQGGSSNAPGISDLPVRYHYSAPAIHVA
ncbi:unnamed protein product [Bursaphelenchus xylophilus]|uniref:(pine wood nematode) hypothetical protein n=1 Tax=Bursaphelenchus xylophilus TaxID=6326 RepID=A0A1I7RS41_BURXY|nr:unnamed protein product [Bursaphelenchus xylophilus]CAG9123244.1 unnamed protein product [Bursaphelenchus xylophilus]